MIRFVLLIGLIFSCININAQIRYDSLDNNVKRMATKNRNSDTNYIRYYDEIAVHVYSTLNISNFTLGDQSTGYNIRYAPVLSPSIGIGVSKYGLMLNIANDFGIVSQSNEKFGETQRLVAIGSLIYKKIALKLYLNWNKGFYISNPESYQSNWDEPFYPQRPDVAMLGFGINQKLIFNDKKFSLNGSYNLTQKQLKSAGSFLAGGSFDGLIISGDSSLIPKQMQANMNEHISFTRSAQYSFGISGGYSYTFVFLKNFNFNILAMPGISYSNTAFKNHEEQYKSENQHSFRPLLHFSGALAYVNRYFYFGLNAYVNNFWIDTGDNTLIKYEIVNGKFFLGYRIGSRKK